MIEIRPARPTDADDMAEGWGIIGTHIHPDAGRSGLGRRLLGFTPYREAGDTIPHRYDV